MRRSFSSLGCYGFGWSDLLAGERLCPVCRRERHRRSLEGARKVSKGGDGAASSGHVWWRAPPQSTLVTRPKIQTRSGPKGLKRWLLCAGRSSLSLSLSMWDSPFKVEQLIQVASTVLKIKMPKESERLGSHKVVKVFAISTS